jgi:hypothetical protein
VTAALAISADPTPLTNRGVYPQATSWTESAFDYYRATVCSSVELVLSDLCEHLDDGRGINRETGPAVRHYGQHVQLRNWKGDVLASIFWGGANIKPNVEAKGSCAPAVAGILRRLGEHRPSRLDVKRDATAPALFATVRELALAYSQRLGLAFQELANHSPDKGDTVYLGSRQSQVMLRIYQPGLKRAQEEGRWGSQVSPEEREAVRVELEFKPHKDRAKAAAAALAPDQLWGVSPWTAEFASEVFAMSVQPISIAERRESNRNRALRFMASQYQAHLADLLRECGGDLAAFGATIADLAEIQR